MNSSITLSKKRKRKSKKKNETARPWVCLCQFTHDKFIKMIEIVFCGFWWIVKEIDIQKKVTSGHDPFSTLYIYVYTVYKKLINRTTSLFANNQG